MNDFKPLDYTQFSINEVVMCFPPAGRAFEAIINQFYWNSEKHLLYCKYSVYNDVDEGGLPIEYSGEYPFVERYFGKKEEKFCINKSLLEEFEES